MEHKYFCLVLHSHIPYVVGHGSWPHGTDWLYEAAAESYLPLADVLIRLKEEGISPQVTISFTPVLADQLKSPVFVAGFDAYLAMQAAAAASDRQYFEKTGQREFIPLATFWQGWYERLRRDFFERYRGDIIGTFKDLQDEGDIEVIASAATHGYFPLLSRDESITDQVRQGILTYRRYFGQEPKGFWLPECAYRPGYAWSRPLGGQSRYPRRGVDELLKDEGFVYFFVDSYLLKGGEARGVYADRFPALKELWEKFNEQYTPTGEIERTPYLPYFAHPSGLAFFVRDEISGAQVWSRFVGYPGDGSYLEFHKKHFPGGLRYWKITSAGSDLADKEPYDPEGSVWKMDEHADHFVGVLEQRLAGRPAGTVVSLYDTELFGHWWFEGPEWLYRILKKASASRVRPLTASRCLERIPAQTLISLPEGSWGKGGFHWIWMNEDTSWIWEKIYRIEDLAASLDIPVLTRTEELKRILRQFRREKFLLESSDWPFLISTWSARDYAERRAAEHSERAAVLGRWLRRGQELNAGEAALLDSWENEDRLFEEIIESHGRAL